MLRLFEVTDWTFAYCGFDQANKYFKCLDVYFKCLFRLQFKKAATEKNMPAVNKMHTETNFDRSCTN